MGKKTRRARSVRAEARNGNVRGNSAGNDSVRNESIRGDARHSAQDDRHPALSGLRGLAALGVFAVHAYALAGFPSLWPQHSGASFLLAWPLRMGWAGVDVFFTLSAFLLALPFARAHLDHAPAPSLRGYAARRLLRIIPAYALQLSIILVLIATGLAAAIISPAQITAMRLIVQPLFLYDLGWPGLLPMQWPLMGSWWTLPVELSFYLLLPWLARLLRPGRWPWLLLGIAFAWIWRALLLWTHPRSPEVEFLVEHLPGRIDQFLIGMLAAYALYRAPRGLAWIAGRRADGLFLIAALLFLLLPALGYVNGVPMDSESRAEPWLIGWHTYASVAVAGMLLAVGRAAPLASAIVGALPLRLLGRISYGFYLWHLPILLWMHAEGGVAAFGGPAAFVLDGLLFSLAAAMLSWALIERPALRLAARWPHRLQSQPAR